MYNCLHVVYIVMQGLIQLLRAEGVELWDVPNPLVERRKPSSSRKLSKIDETADWTDYV